MKKYLKVSGLMNYHEIKAQYFSSYSFVFQDIGKQSTPNTIPVGQTYLVYPIFSVLLPKQNSN